MNIDKLREHLFDTLEKLKDPDNPMEIERAKAISEVAQTIVNTAKVEVDHMRYSGRPSKSDFIPQAELKPLPGPEGSAAAGRRPALPGRR